MELQGNNHLTETQLINLISFCRDSDNYHEAMFSLKKNLSQEEFNNCTERDVIETMIDLCNVDEEVHFEYIDQTYFL